MSSVRKIAIGLGIAGGALLAAWLLSGNRKSKAKEFITRKAQDLKRTLTKDKESGEEADVHYI